MAKNLHQQIIDGTVMVQHEGVDGEFDLPVWMLELSEALQSVPKFIKVLVKHKILLAFLHAGLKECMVGFRAHCRPKKDTSITTVTQAHADTYKPERQDVPQENKTKQSQKEYILELRAKGMTDSEIMEHIIAGK